MAGARVLLRGCNCDAICPCRSVHGAPGGPSTYGECYGTLSWHVHEGSAGGRRPLRSAGRDVAALLRPTPAERRSGRSCSTSTTRADDAQLDALADIFLGRAGGTVAQLYGPAIGDVHAVRRARITVEHVAPRKRIDVSATSRVEAEGAGVGSRRRAVRDSRASTIPAPNYGATGSPRTTRCCASKSAAAVHASFASDFDYKIRELTPARISTDMESAVYIPPAFGNAAAAWRFVGERGCVQLSVRSLSP